MECDNSCHFVLYYNDLKDLEDLNDWSDWKKELLKLAEDPKCSGDEELKRYLRNMFYFVLRRHTIYNKKMKAENRHTDDYPVIKLVLFLLRSATKALMATGDVTEFILNSNGDEHPERMVLERDATGEEKSYRSVNWECENGMDDEANKMCKRFVEIAFKYCRSQWKHSCVIDSPYNNDSVLEGCCGEYLAEYLTDLLYCSEEKFYACAFDDDMADYNGKDIMFSKIEHGEVDVRKICKWEGLD